MSLFTHEIITYVKNPKEILNAPFRNSKVKRVRFQETRLILQSSITFLYASN